MDQIFMLLASIFAGMCAASVVLLVAVVVMVVCGFLWIRKITTIDV